MQQKRNGLPARHELKYFINPAELEALRARLRPVLQMDSHCVGGRPYVIRSLYFDTIYDQDYFEKAAGTWEFIKKHFIDPESEWTWETYADGSPVPVTDPSDPLKCPYHTSRVAVLSVPVLEAFVSEA